MNRWVYIPHYSSLDDQITTISNVNTPKEHIMSGQESQKKMTYVRLGNSGLKVSRIILGLMTYGSKDWAEWVLEEEEAIKHIKKAYELGIQTFDTANVYSNGESERIFGKAIKELNLPRDEIVVMTKLYATVGRTPKDKFADRSQAEANGYVNQSGLSRKRSSTLLNDSNLIMLTSYNVIVSITTPPSRRLCKPFMMLCKRAMLAILECQVATPTSSRDANYAINNKLTPFISMQNHHSLLYREEEREMIPTLKMFGVGMIPWSPLARGQLGRPVSQSEATDRSQKDAWGKYLDKTKEANNKIISRVEEVAKSKGISMAQVAIAWSLSKDGMTAPIIGTTNLQNLEDIVGSIHVKLTEEEIKQLEELYIPQAIVGHT
ncbi:aldo kereductase [Rhizoctonia solani]|uniref:Aldo kereductase n=1 Tax=Rhizoctonia solani TaxID=456999 RepID=A0A8H7I1D7_9AGAM|nr:aldo kereductase [Rhizoctonia solani]